MSARRDEEIAEQLCLGFKAEELEFSRAAGFAENVAFMREVLRVLENGRRGVVFVLEEFDLRTDPSRRCCTR